MAKSKGNFITLRTLIQENYDPLDYRYFCLGGHYRSQLQFSTKSLDAARAARLNLMERIEQLHGESDPGDFDAIGDSARSYSDEFIRHVYTDLHIPQALSVVWTLLKDASVSAGDKLAVLYEMDKILGLKLSNREPKLELDQDSRNLIEERESARENRDFARADEIRDILLEKGIVVKDTPEGTKWSRKL